MPHPIHRIVCTYSHTYINPPAHLTSLPADVHNVSRRIFCSPSPTIPPCSSPPPPPVPLWPTAAHRIVSMSTILHGRACMYAGLAVWRHVCMYAEGRSRSIFSLSSSFSSPDRPRRCFQISHLMDLCAGDALRVSFCRLDLTLLLFRAKRRTKVADFIVEAAFAAVSHTYTTHISKS
jgi:hypothetical protein